MRYKLRILSLMVVPLLVSPVLAEDFTYKDYAKVSEAWRHGFVFGISQYMSAVAQPDEEPPYPVRTALKRCLSASTDRSWPSAWRHMLRLIRAFLMRR
jgi:hypothetical protein